MNLCIITAHCGADSLSDAVLSWGGGVPLFIQDGRRGMLPAYFNGHSFASAYDVVDGGDRLCGGFSYLAFLHDDLLIHDPQWPDRVLKEFEDPKVGLVGFGGALGHGSPRLYREPYDYHNLGRVRFMSNMVDAENHGERFTGERDVAVLDGFALIFRREVLEQAHGWPLNTPINYIAYDYWASCVTRELGYRIRLVGVSCTHLGGRSFVKLGIGKREDHWQKYLDAHRYIYDRFASVLPYEVPR